MTKIVFSILEKHTFLLLLSHREAELNSKNVIKQYKTRCLQY